MCTEIEHIVWIGGESVIGPMLEEEKFMQFLSNTVAQRSDPDLLRVQALQTIAVICRVSDAASDQFRENQALMNVMEVVCGDDAELVQSEGGARITS